MKVQILGTGCPKCKLLASNAEQAIRDSGVDAELEKITSITEIAKFGIMMTPGLAIDGEVKSAGKLLSPADIEQLIRAAAG